MGRPFRTLAGLVAIFVAGCSSLAGADESSTIVRIVPMRFTISFNVGSQPSSTTFSEPVTGAVYLEPLAISSAYSIPSGALFDGGLAVRVLDHVGVGLSVSSFRRDGSTSIDASVPHPFFYQRPRSLNGTVPERRSETATHLQLQVFTWLPRHSRLVLSAGPSWFAAKQDIVTGITFTEAYPYDTATFATATPTRVSKNGVGFNLGAEVQVPLARHFGVGATVRYAHATVDFGVPNASGNVRSDVGGLQAGGGLRLFF